MKLAFVFLLGLAATVLPGNSEPEPKVYTVHLQTDGPTLEQIPLLHILNVLVDWRNGIKEQTGIEIVYATSTVGPVLDGSSQNDFYSVPCHAVLAEFWHLDDTPPMDLRLYLTSQPLPCGSAFDGHAVIPLRGPSLEYEPTFDWQMLFHEGGHLLGARHTFDDGTDNWIDIENWCGPMSYCGFWNTGTLQYHEQNVALMQAQAAE